MSGSPPVKPRTGILAAFAAKVPDAFLAGCLSQHGQRDPLAVDQHAIRIENNQVGHYKIRVQDRSVPVITDRKEVQ
jgi:hypothetical protein